VQGVMYTCLLAVSRDMGRYRSVDLREGVLLCGEYERLSVLITRKGVGENRKDNNFAVA